MTRQEKFNQMIQSATSTKERMFLSSIYLFSAKGFANVGIRELCRSVNVKESAFYNHYASKDDLLMAIFERFVAISNRAPFSDVEFQSIVSTGDIETYLQKSMAAFTDCIHDPLYFAILQIINMESYTNPKAFAMVKRNEYVQHTASVLNQMMAGGFLKKQDMQVVSSAFYYGLKGLVNDVMLKDAWDENTEALQDMIQAHVQLFLGLLKPSE